MTKSHESKQTLDFDRESGGIFTLYLSRFQTSPFIADSSPVVRLEATDTKDVPSSAMPWDDDDPVCFALAQWASSQAYSGKTASEIAGEIGLHAGLLPGEWPELSDCD